MSDNCHSRAANVGRRELSLSQPARQSEEWGSTSHTHTYMEGCVSQSSLHTTCLHPTLTHHPDPSLSLTLTFLHESAQFCTAGLRPWKACPEGGHLQCHALSRCPVGIRVLSVGQHLPQQDACTACTRGRPATYSMHHTASGASLALTKRPHFRLRCEEEWAGLSNNALRWQPADRCLRGRREGCDQRGWRRGGAG